MYTYCCNVWSKSTHNVQHPCRPWTGWTRIFWIYHDEDLRAVVRDIKVGMPDIGQSIRGVLDSRGIHVPTTRIRQCLSDVDPINTALRWASPITRRAYSVPHPNALWHMDGNHKLVR